MEMQKAQHITHNEEKMPFFSIIVPVYNVAPYLRECLDSVLAQTFEDWECLCVDDGSTDESGTILDEYVQKDKRFRVFHKKNGGVALVRQFGLERIQGQWLVWLDSDDILLPSYLLDFYNCIIEKNVDFVWTDYCELSKTIRRISQKCEENALSLANGIVNGPIFSVLWNKAISIDFLREKKISFKDCLFPVCEDLCFIASILSQKNIRLSYLPVANYIYRLRIGSITHFKKEQKLSLKDYNVACNVQKIVEKFLNPLSEEIRANLMLWRKALKYRWYTLDVVPDNLFLSLYPEIKDLSGINVHCVHKIMFWFAVRGFRREIRFFFRLFRKAKKLLNKC